jgi:hypothetical protein
MHMRRFLLTIERNNLAIKCSYRVARCHFTFSILEVTEARTVGKVGYIFIARFMKYYCISILYPMRPFFVFLLAMSYG